MPETLVTVAYIVAGLLFIMSLSGLSAQATAPRGNLFGFTDALGISTSQIISLIVVAFAVLFMIYRLRAGNRKEIL